MLFLIGIDIGPAGLVSLTIMSGCDIFTSLSSNRSMAPVVLARTQTGRGNDWPSDRVKWATARRGECQIRPGFEQLVENRH